MAGGTFEAFNKVRPGAYINFKAAPEPFSVVGSRGTAALPLSLSDWGEDYVELTASDLIDGKSLSKIGLTLSDSASRVLRLALTNANKLLIAKTTKNGKKAKAELKHGGSELRLTVTARHAGILGNRLSIIVKRVAESTRYDVLTNLDNITKDSQRIENFSQLADNEWVVFSHETNDSPVETASLKLSGGTNGEESEESIVEAMNRLKNKAWHTMGIMSDNANVKRAASMLIRTLREKEGIKRQLVLCDAGGVSGENYEGIISVSQGYVDSGGEKVTKAEFAAYVTGLTAGSSLTQSNTYHVVRDAVKIEGKPETHEEIEEALRNGQLVLSVRSDGAIVIESDINTLCDYPKEKSRDFSKNRIVRCLDEIANSVSLSWHKSYIGKVDNSSRGRNLFKADIINYLKELESLGAIEGFDKDTDIAVLQGRDIDSVVCEISVKPVDSMEKLYMTVNVGG